MKKAVIKKQEKYLILQKKYLIFSVLILIIIVLMYNLNNNMNTINSLNKRVNQLENDVQNLVSDLQSKAKTIQQQTQTISDLAQDIKEKEQQIESQRIKIESLTSQVQSLSSELTQTKGELEETTRLLDIAKNYEERVQQGVNLNKAYILLGDYDKTVDIVADITDISKPNTNQELWLRGKKIYDWLGTYYDYCSDKGFCIGENYCTQIQFFSPDELLYYGSQDVLCGDCDDKAQLFAGMLYASGVSHDKVRVECGDVPGGRHCWNAIYVNNQWYRIDSVCSNPASFVLEKFGLGFLSSATYPSNDYRDVDCFSSYETTSWYNPEGYHTM